MRTKVKKNFKNYENILRSFFVEFYYKSSKWKRLAKRAMIRDNYQCQISKRYGKNVPAKVVHHIYPVEHFPEYAYSLWNLICLSEAEHNRMHDRKTGKLTEAGLNLMRRTKIPPPHDCQT